MRRFVVLISLIALPALAQTVDQRIDRELPSLIQMYQSLHAAPELSMQEAKTSAFVATRLRALGYDVTERVGKYPNASITCYGVVAVMKNGAGPVVMLRTDMDALPVSEQTGLPFASTVKAKPISEDATGEETPVMH